MWVTKRISEKEEERGKGKRREREEEKKKSREGRGREKRTSVMDSMRDVIVCSSNFLGGTTSSSPISILYSLPLPLLLPSPLPIYTLIFLLTSMFSSFLSLLSSWYISIKDKRKKDKRKEEETRGRRRERSFGFINRNWFLTINSCVCSLPKSKDTSFLFSFLLISTTHSRNRSFRYFTEIHLGRRRKRRRRRCVAWRRRRRKRRKRRSNRSRNRRSIGIG